MKLVYPAVFEFCAEDNSYGAYVPDLPGCCSGGFSLAEAMEMIIDAASGWILGEWEEGKEVPPPSPINSIIPEKTGEFVSYVLLDMDQYISKYSKKCIRKNVTIPRWVNSLGERNSANFSQLLQDAIIKKFGMPSTDVSSIAAGSPRAAEERL